ncbi:FAD:protein FMN transferase [Aliikangiella coralliicola]|uniref:FAD:protein FMN transferase n=1 Tax=Aliikangiella coralliicola TaxID=2592383 RepID=A0A545UHN0_9GAMM|nr:FAD:protein FMN transferase [Aliikangiella coralliicola]TQV88984.1 FAD:protein FMN transferase [Aliikangiella coralliicola]
MNLEYFHKLFISFILLVAVTACQQDPQYARLKGYTMGTTYHVTIEKKSVDEQKLQQAIDNRLAQINQLMSTYIDDSELSLFNKSSSTNCQKLSEDTLYVIKNAIEISQQTKGKFDVTLAPLIEIWGFDKKDTGNQIPTQETIKQLLSQIGYEKISIGNNCVAKQTDKLSINLSAIAKGYAVDEIANTVKAHGVKNYLVEIGGEIASKGVNAKGISWQIAIESASSKDRSIQKIIAPKGLSVATSGDYRNYFEKNGQRYSHTIDPTTGFPITHKLASVTVLHKEAMMADAIATAMMVMGPDDSLKLANEYKLPVFMLVKNENGFEEVFSDGFKQYVK